MAKSEENKFGIALLQLKPSSEKYMNLATAQRLARKAVDKYNPKIIVLPECFNSTFGIPYFDDNAENIPDGATTKILSQLAKELNVYIVGGSYPERDSVKKHIIYNTTTVFSREGELVATHRKVHLTNVRQESTTITAGNTLNTFYVDGYKFGLGISYDMFFSEFSQLYQQQGCHMIFFPSAFPKDAGQYWDFKLRSRASDNQIFVAGISAARKATRPNSLVSYGYSCFVNPDGEIVKQAGKHEKILYHAIDFGDIVKIRNELLFIRHRRTDVYRTILAN